MAIDHFGGPVTRITQETIGFVSVAEGFVFISGIVAGLVYGRTALLQPEHLTARTLKRARLLYFSHIGTILALIVLSRFSGEFAQFLHEKVDFFHSSQVVLWSALLLHQPQFLDILPMYVFFLLVTPFLLRQILRGRQRLVLTASFLLWAAAQAGLRTRFLFWVKVGLGASFSPGMFDLFAWQFLFILGLTMGAHRIFSGTYHPPFSGRTSFLVVAATLALFFLRNSAIGVRLHENIPLTGRGSLGPLRLLNFLLLAYSLSLIAGKLRLGGVMRWFAFLGRHSLQVYVFHTVVIYFLLPIRPHIFALGTLWEGALSLAFALSMTLPAWAHQQWARRKKRQAEPVAAVPPAVTEREVSGG